MIWISDFKGQKPLGNTLKKSAPPIAANKPYNSHMTDTCSSMFALNV